MIVKQSFITIPAPVFHHQAMLDNEEMARRVCFALDNSPRGVQAAISREREISAQAVTGWRSSGLVDKAHIPALARHTRRRVEYFLDESVSDSESAATATASEPDWADVTGYAQAVGLGDGAEAQEYAETHSLKFKASSLRKRGIYGHPLHVYYGKGDSMAPTIKDGDAILFDSGDTRPLDGVLFVVQIGKEIYVKRAEILDDAVYFRSDNPSGDHGWRKPRRMDNKKTPITVIGRVHWVGGWAE